MQLTINNLNVRKKEEGVDLMNKNSIKNFLIIFVVCLLALMSINVRAQDIYPASPPLFTDQELDDILSPIALYPDPLLAQILPASTYTEEILDAYDWLDSGGSISEIEWQSWDESVKAIARYPDVLKMMAEYSDWTANLGDAFLNQPEDVTRSIQRLRWQARDMGNLESNSRQNIVIVGDYIEILPARPQYVYVPSYDPSIVYYERYYSGSEPFITFGIGLMIGSWLTMDFDWHNHHVIYHGWNRPGWVNQARPHVRVKDLYVQRTRPFINKNWRHDNSHGNPESFRTARPGGAPGTDVKSRLSEIRGRSVKKAPSKPSPKVLGPAGDKRSFGNRGWENKVTEGASPDVKNQPPKVIPRISQRPEHRTPEVKQKPELPSSGDGQKDTSPTSSISGKAQRPSFGSVKETTPTGSTGESVQSSRTPSVTFGGYRGASEARGQSIRGQASRQSRGRARTSAVPEAKDRTPEKKGSPGRGDTPEKKGGSKGDAPKDEQAGGDRSRR
jgi:hypothetical protein